ncbi:MAG: YybS family protein [Syntrophales bacterium]|nr:YybS family protein [Syntrophales bacterium]
MNNAKKIAQALKTVLKNTLLLSLLTLTAIFVPLIGSFILVMIPLPIVLLFAKVGRTGGAITVTLAFLITHGISRTIAVSPLSFLPFIFFVSLGIVLSELFEKNLSIEKTTFLCSLFGFSALFLFILFYSYQTNTPPLEVVKGYIAATIKKSVDLYSRMDILPEQISQIKENTEEIITFLTYTSPALALISITLTVWLNIVSAREILIMNNLPSPSFGDLTKWKAPDWYVWFFIASGTCIILPTTTLKWVGINGLMICLMVYLIQGVAIIAYFFKTKNVPRILRYVFYMFLVFQQYLLIPVILLGLFDLWVNFRKHISSPDLQ